MKRITVLALAVALALTACTDSDPEATPSPSPSPSLTPSPSISPTPSPSPSPVVEALCPGWDDGLDEEGVAAIDFNRYAGICLGMSFAEASATYAGPPLVGEDYCPWVTAIVEVDDLGLYVHAYTFPEDPGEEIWLFKMIWLDDPAIAWSHDLPAHADGGTIGAMEGDIFAWYPTGSMVTHDDPSRGMRTQWVVPGPNNTAIAFDLTEGVVSEMSWGNRITGGGPWGELCAI